MLSRADLHQYRKTDLTGCNLSELVDLRTVSVDKGQTPDKRIESFVSQVHNPYLFRVNDVAIKVEFAGTKPFSQVLPRCLDVGK